jgi:hypothetical protein
MLPMSRPRGGGGGNVVDRRSAGRPGRTGRDGSSGAGGPARWRRVILLLMALVAVTPLLFLFLSSSLSESTEVAADRAPVAPPNEDEDAGGDARTGTAEETAYWADAAIEVDDAADGGRPVAPAAHGRPGRRPAANAADGPNTGVGVRIGADVSDGDRPAERAATSSVPAARRRPAGLPGVAAPFLQGFDLVDSVDGEMAVVTRRLTVGALGPEASFLLAAWSNLTSVLSPWQCLFQRDRTSSEVFATDAVEARAYERDCHRVLHCPIPPLLHAQLIQARRNSATARGELVVWVALRGPHPFAPLPLPVPDVLPLTATELAAAREPESFHVCLSALHQLWWPDYTVNFLVEALEYWRVQGARSITLYLRMADLPELVATPVWRAVLRHYVDSGLLTVVDARPLNQTHLFYGGQELQLNDCFLRLRVKSRLVIFGDLDELFWLRQDNTTLRDYLSTLYQTAIQSDAASGRMTVAFMSLRQMTLVTDMCEAPAAVLNLLHPNWRPGEPLTDDAWRALEPKFADKNVQRALARSLDADPLRWRHLVLVDPAKDPYDRPKYVANTRNLLAANIHVPETLSWLRSAHIEAPDTELLKLHARLLPIERPVCRVIRPERAVLLASGGHGAAGRAGDVYFYELAGPLYADFMVPAVDAARLAIRQRIATDAA